MRVDLYLTPVPFAKAALENKTVAVIDVLRSSTSICAALMNGAKGVIPTEGPGEAGEMWSKVGSEMAVLAGERHGVKIDNFQLGNSPTEFSSENIGGKFVIMTTTNGTSIFGKTHNAVPVISAGLVNISRVAHRVAREGKDLVIVCSGREGHFSIEDTLCGGMLIHLLIENHHLDIEANDAASLALLLYQTNRSRLRETIEQGEHGRFLDSIGFGGDLAIAALPDSMPVLPVLKDGRLILES
jgi:2-phosphosulfolactate phosphatase